LHFSRQSRRTPELAGSLGLGVLAACTVLLPRVLIASAVLTPDVARHLLAVLAPPFVLGVGLVLVAVLRRQPAKPAVAGEEPHSPLGLSSAIQMAVAFQVVLWVVEWAQRAGGQGGVLATAALLGLTDVDALTVAMNRLGRAPGQAGLAASAIGIGIVSNTLLKLALTLVLGTPAFRRVASIGLLALAAAVAVGVWLAWG
ncbi:MAG TPA: DUF4010 domain-containing protein, partial [Gemmatimonadaceae bacterium]|nr:DUF4010 domain-containing protein [Gemmatimonadaceae bacterium]